MKSGLLAAAVAAVFAAGVPAYALAKDACKNVKFEFVNNHDAKIRVTRIKYWNSHARKTQTEDVKNVECAKNKTCKTNGDNLGNASLVDLYHIRAVYEELENDGKWSKPFVSSLWLEPIGDDRQCKKDKVYTLIRIPGPPTDGLL